MATQAWLKIHEELGIKTLTPEDRPVGSYVEEHARLRPNSPALRYFSRTFDYAEYNSEANKLANALIGLGVERGDVVGVHMPNIPQYLIAIIAISKIGAIGSGVSPLLAPPEIAYQIADAKVKVLLTLSDLGQAISALIDMPECLKAIITCGAGDYLGAPDVQPISLGDVKASSFQSLIAGQSSEFSQVDMHWNDTFMIQYTGGTTGRPKGAELSIRNVVHNPVLVSSADPENELGKEVFASGFPLFHIAGLSFGIGAAVFGASYELYPNPRDIDHIVATFKANPPTRVAGVPALYDMMLAHPEFKTLDFSALKGIRMGAAPMTSSTYEGLKAVVGEGKISDVFGMTETGPCYVTHPAARYKPGAVGIPLAGTDLKIMDTDTGTREMNVGEPGEICSSGPQIMKGYLGLPEESARALREIDGKLWMYSGDVGYLDEEGYLFLCDRAKDMLIVGGFKVFSVEVEDKLQGHPAIYSSAVIGTPDEKRPGNDVVNLYVQLKPEFKNADEAKLKTEILDFMRANMAPYKVAKHIFIIEEIPLTPVGKIDKKSLRV